MNTNEFRADRSYSERLPRVPHGYYLSDRNTMDIRVDEPAASAVRTIFKLYIGGWGYKKIAEYMNELDSPAPGTANSDSLCKKAGRSTKWSISSIESILKMDFYVGTLRGTAGYAREQAGPVIADHHEPIVDYRTFMLVKSLLQKRSELHYRGQKKYEHLYSGFLFCGDCGAPMFAVSRRDLAPAYTCGTYHRCGTRGCSAHHTRTDRLNRLFMNSLRHEWEQSQSGVERTRAFLTASEDRIRAADTAVENLLDKRNTAKLELKRLMLQNIRSEQEQDPGAGDAIRETIDSLTQAAAARVSQLGKQLNQNYAQRNAWIRIRRAAQTTLDVFEAAVQKRAPSREDLGLLLDRILVFENRIEIRLKPDVEAFLSGVVGPETRLQDLTFSGKPQEAALYA